MGGIIVGFVESFVFVDTVFESLPVFSLESTPILGDILNLVRKYPVSSFVLGVGLIVFLFFIGFFLIRKKRKKAEKFLERVSDIERASILMHPNPDPDAMACAAGLQYLIQDNGVDSEILYPGQIRHPENRVFEVVLDLDFQRIEKNSQISSDFIILVDHGSPRGFEGSEEINPDIVIDHHTDEGKADVFTDIRPDYGACSSIIAEYFRDLRWKPKNNTDENSNIRNHVLPSFITTGLVYGIQSDTKNLTKGCSDAEFKAVSYLYKGVDQEILDRIGNPEIDPEMLDIKARAINNRQIDGPYAISYVGETSNIDAIPNAADELLRLEGINAVIVFGNKDKQIHLSGRSRDDRIHMAKTIQEALKDTPSTHSGGHARMAGAQIQTENIQRKKLTENLFNALKRET